jgi:hypothetical protein
MGKQTEVFIHSFGTKVTFQVMSKKLINWLTDWMTDRQTNKQSHSLSHYGGAKSFLRS